MKRSLRRWIAVAGLLAFIGSATSARAHIDFGSPSDHVVKRTVSVVSNDDVIAPTAKSTSTDSSSLGSISCCDNNFCGCDGCGCRPGLLSRLCGTGRCDGLCDGGCDSGGCRSGLLGYGIIKPSDRCFDDFISPVTNPVYFEDPRTLTEVRFIFLHHNLPTALGGNSVQAYAAQIRLALSERLSFIAVKDGLLYTQSPVLDNGFLDLNAGFKYNLIRDPCAGRIVSVGTTYEIPVGSQRTFQGLGDGEFNFFVTSGTRLFGSHRAHWLSANGLRQPLDENAGNRVAYWSNHFNYMLNTRRPVYVFTEFHWWHYLTNGGGAVNIEGGDIFNLGAPAVRGNNLVTQAVGTRIKLRRNVEAGSAYEFPLTQRDGLMRDRLTMDLIVRY